MVTLRLIEGGLDVFLILFLAASCWLTPDFTRRDLLFGVTVAPNARATSAGRRIIRGYRIGVAVIAVAALASLGAALVFAPASWWQSGVPAIAVLIVLAAYAIPYLIAYRASRQLRVPTEVEGGEAIVREAELRPRRYSEYVPLVWEALPIALIVATALYLASLYPSAPAIIPIHWSASGVPNGFAARSVASFFALVWTQIGTYLLITGLSVLAVRAKAQPGAASYRFRRVTLRFLFLLKSLLMLVFGIMAAIVSRAAVQGTEVPSWLTLVVVVPVLLAVVAFLGVALRIGQGGAKLENTTATQIDRMDDRYWLFGVIYVNRNDPAFLVERRFGYGWTFNLGNAWAWAALVLLLAVPIGAVAVRAVTRIH